MHIYERVKVIVHVDVGFQTCMCSVTCSNIGCMLKNGGNPRVEILALKWGTEHSNLTKSRQLIEWSHEGQPRLTPSFPGLQWICWLSGWGALDPAEQLKNVLQVHLYLWNRTECLYYCYSKMYLFIWLCQVLAAPGELFIAACRIFCCGFFLAVVLGSGIAQQHVRS